MSVGVRGGGAVGGDRARERAGRTRGKHEARHGGATEEHLSGGALQGGAILCACSGRCPHVRCNGAFAGPIYTRRALPGHAASATAAAPGRALDCGLWRSARSPPRSPCRCLRKRLRLPAAATVAATVAGPLGTAILHPRTKTRDAVLFAQQMWAFTVVHELPYDDPEALRARLRVRYPIATDRVIGLGRLPNWRLQKAFARPEGRDAVRSPAHLRALGLVPGAARLAALHPDPRQRELRPRRPADGRRLRPRLRRPTSPSRRRRPGGRRRTATRATRRSAG